MDLSLIVVNYNTKKITADCLKTIKESKDKVSKEVIVVDNGSNDGSIEYLKSRFPQYKVFSSGGNLGFSQGNNFGVKRASGEYVWLLNSDTLLKKNTISELMKTVKTKNSMIASCRLLNSDGSIQPQGGYLPYLFRVALWMLFIDDLPILKHLVKPYHQNLISYFKADQKPEWLSGTALLIKRSWYNQLKGLDKDIFMYAEDVDFCWRSKKLGVTPDYFSRPALTHLGQASGSSRGAILGEYKGFLYLYQKYGFAAWQLGSLRLLLKTGAWLRKTLLGRQVYAEAFNLV